jgi:hypothetical protein
MTDEHRDPLLKQSKKQVVSKSDRKGCSRSAFWALCMLLIAIIYTTAPFLPHAVTIIRYVCTGRFSELDQVIRYDLYWDLAERPDTHVFFDLTPTPLSDEHTREIMWTEYQNFRMTQEVPSFLELDPEYQQHTDPNGVWKTLFLRVYGVDTCMAKQFPETLKAVDASGLNAMTVMFTRMAPGQRIARHVGPTKLVLRLLLALKVPKAPGAHLKVWHKHNGSATRLDWTKAGDEYIFDDTFVHAAHNPTEEERVALFIDMKRPDMKGWRERLINHIVLEAIRILPFSQKQVIINRTNKLCQAADE